MCYGGADELLLRAKNCRRFGVLFFFLCCFLFLLLWGLFGSYVISFYNAYLKSSVEPALDKYVAPYILKAYEQWLKVFPAKAATAAGEAAKDL